MYYVSLKIDHPNRSVVNRCTVNNWYTSADQIGLRVVQSFLLVPWCLNEDLVLVLSLSDCAS